jgi:pimeloyl-ACP methyl ester carboxylesterase/lysophospholipase L1-like esterase
LKTLRDAAVTASVGVAIGLTLLTYARAGTERWARAEPDKVSSWETFARRDFTIDGRHCLLVVPASAAKGQPWIWRTEFFGHQPQADLALLHKGFHVAYMDVQNLFGAPVALDHMDQFYDHLTAVRGLAKKVVLEGFSRGGLFSLNWAARHPDRVACIYNDAPVCDFKSWPGGKGKGKGSADDWRRCLKVYGLTEQQALEYKWNPVDNLEALAKAKVPLLHVCGDADDVVPIEENTRLVETRYRKLGGPITVIAKPGVGHHPHSLENPEPIVAFVLKHTIGGSATLVLPESPSDYRVFQRQSRDTGVIHLRGGLVAEAGLLRCRVTSAVTDAKTPAIVRDWQPVVLDLVRGRFDSEITVPAGGWYRVQLRLERDGAILAEAAVEHVGVGEVFVIAGQSNSTNCGSEKQKTTTGMVASFDGNRWVMANDPQPGVQDGSKGGSFLPAFGDALYAKYHVPIGVASTGAGATSVREWLPKGERMKNQPTTGAHVRSLGRNEWECTGTLFDGLITRIKAIGPRGCRAVLWHQGESDAGQAREGYPANRQITGKQYDEFLERLIRASRKSAGWELPWFVARATYHSEQDPSDDEFRAAQKSLCERGVALEGPDTDTLRKAFRAGVHFNARGLQAHGLLWADKVDTWLDRALEEPGQGQKSSLSPRGSLNNSHIQFETKKSGHVAFMGGSITEMEGYRPLVRDWLTRRFPETKFTFTNAGISSTCSTTGAFRLATDVLDHGPVDLFFLEFAVNDDQDAHHDRRDCIRGMEGIIRHVLVHNPNADIVLIYFVNSEMLKTTRDGKLPLTISSHEEVARHYSVSAVNVAKELAERIGEGTWTWDRYGGVHPARPGNELCAALIEGLLTRAWMDMLLAKSTTEKHRLPDAPLDANSYGTGHFIDPKNAVVVSEWKLEKPDWRNIPGQWRERFRDIPLLSATKAGAELTLAFEGRAIGAYLLAGPDAGIVEYSIDDGPLARLDMLHAFSRGLHYPRTVMFAADLKPGPHILRLRLVARQSTATSGSAARIIQFVAN